MLQPAAVQICPVRRADVLEPDAVAARLDLGVLRRGVLVLLELDVVLRASPERQVGRVELPLLAFVERGALEHDEPAGLDRVLLAEPWSRPRRAGVSYRSPRG